MIRGFFISLFARLCKLLNDQSIELLHDDVIKWKHFPHYWPFVWGIHRPPVNSQHKSQWRGAAMFSLIYFWINGWENNREAGDLRRYRAHYDVSVMQFHMPQHSCVVTVMWNEMGDVEVLQWMIYVKIICVYFNENISPQPLLETIINFILWWSSIMRYLNHCAYKVQNRH